MKCDTIPDLERFLNIQEQALGDSSAEVAATACKLADLYMSAERFDEAERLLNRALTIQKNLVGFHHADVAKTSESLSRLDLLRGENQKRKNSRIPANPVTNPTNVAANSTKSQCANQNGISVHPKPSQSNQNGIPVHPKPSQSNQNNIPVHSKPPQSNPVNSQTQMSPIGRLPVPSTKFSGGRDVTNAGKQSLSSSKNLSDAVKETELELALLKQMVGADDTSVADLLTKLADLYCRLRMYSQMEPILVDALKIREAACGSTHPSVSTELKNLAKLYLVQERYALAEPLFKRALAIREKAYGRMHPRVADIEEQYSLLLRKTNRAYLADTLDQHVNAIRAQHIADGSVTRKTSMFNGSW